MVTRRPRREATTTVDTTADITEQKAEKAATATIPSFGETESLRKTVLSLTTELATTNPKNIMRTMLSMAKFLSNKNIANLAFALFDHRRRLPGAVLHK